LKVSAWSVVKNEAQFIGYGLMSILPYVDEVVYFDGNSTDGTLRLLDYIKGKYDPQNKIKVFLDKDFSDFKQDYVRVFNECMKACSGDYLFYLHPDMICVNPGDLLKRDKWQALAYWAGMRSFAGEDLGLEITKGRTNAWKLIMKNSFGLHYAGYYGSPEEDMYFRSITGKEYVVHKDMRKYPYEVKDSGINLWHFCECKPKVRREKKMETVLSTNGADPQTIKEALAAHPRVHLESEKSEWGDFKFEPRKEPLPEVFAKYREEFEAVLK
jgi:glycosyltransferase involved in cell wall biosynthesis